MVYTVRVIFRPLQNVVCFIIVTYLVVVLFKFYIQGVLNFKKTKNSGAKRLRQQDNTVLLCQHLQIFVSIGTPAHQTGDKVYRSK